LRSRCRTPSKHPVVLDRNDARGVRPVLKDASLSEQAVQGLRRVPRQPRGEDQVLISCHRRDRIELDALQTPDLLEHTHRSNGPRAVVGAGTGEVERFNEKPARRSSTDSNGGWA
jgi:hypothetical protein